MALMKRSPRTVRVEEANDEVTQEVAAVIDIEEFQKARQDPVWQSFHDEAIAYRDQLQRDGRSS